MAGPPPPDPSRALQALSFGLVLPSPIEFVSATYNGTHLQQMIGSDPWFSGVRAVQGGVTVGVVLDDQMQQTMPEGTSQIVIKIRVSVPVGTPPGTHTIQFSGSLGTPQVPLLMVMPIGSVTPATQPRTLTVTAGTCMARPLDGYYPAVVGQVVENSSSTAEDQADPSASEGETSGDDGDAEPPPDPSELEFPEPTPEELEVQWNEVAATEPTTAEEEASPAAAEVAPSEAAPIGGADPEPVADAPVPSEPAQVADVPCEPTCPGSSAECFVRGDVNGDGTVELESPDNDYVRLRDYLKGGEPPDCLDAADVNDDGRISLADAVHLLTWKHRGGPEPACPGPNTCGVDPTLSDELGCADSPSCP